jgi:hypothetical protein
MQKDFIPFTEALELKKLRFEKLCYAYVYTGDTGSNIDRMCYISPDLSMNWNEDSLCVSIPTWSSVFDWFEREFNLYSSNFHSFYECFVEYGFYIHTLDGRIILSEGDYPTSLEAKISCLKKLIEIAKKKPL